MLKLDPQDRRLDRIEPAVESDFGVMVVAGVAVDSQAAQLLAEVRVIGGQHAAVTRTTEVFGRKETETADRPEHSRSATAIFGPDRLAGIFDDRNTVAHGDPPQPFHVGTKAEKMHRHDRFCTGSDRRLDRFGIDVERLGIDIHKDRFRTEPADRTGGREKRERAGDDFVTGTDSKRHQGQDQCIGPGRSRSLSVNRNTSRPGFRVG